MPGEAYIINRDLYVWSENESDWKNVGRIEDPTGATGPAGLDGIDGIDGATGPTGPTGPAGPEKISQAYLVSYNTNYPEGGLEVLENERLPIEREELDTGSLVELNGEDTLQFNKTGYYKITIVVSSYVPYNDTDFDPTTDFVSIGFRLVDTDNIYVGASSWIFDELSSQIIAQGIITVEDISNAYELVNLSKRSIYLETPDLENINSNSYFVNAPVNIIIEYLGR